MARRLVRRSAAASSAVRRNGSRAGSWTTSGDRDVLIAHPHASGGHDAARARTLSLACSRVRPFAALVQDPRPPSALVLDVRLGIVERGGVPSLSRCVVGRMEPGGGVEPIGSRGAPLERFADTPRDRSHAARAVHACEDNRCASAATPPASSSRAKPHRRRRGPVGRPAQTPIVR